MKIDYTDVPSEVQAALGPLLDRWLPLFAKKINRLYVKVKDLKDGGLEINVRSRYRDAILTVSMDFLTYGEEERTLFVVHELSHLPVDSLWTEAERLVAATTADAATKKLLRARIEDLAEGLTEDIAHLVLEAAATTTKRDHNDVQ